MKNIKKLFVIGILAVGFGLCFWNVGAGAMSNKFKSSSLKYNSQTFLGEKQKRGIVRSPFISFENINIDGLQQTGKVCKEKSAFKDKSIVHPGFQRQVFSPAFLEYSSEFKDDFSLINRHFQTTPHCVSCGVESSFDL